MKLIILLLAVPACLALPKADFTCPSAGYFANPSDCGSYYACAADLVPVLMECPAGLHFDPNLKICNTPELANCVIGTSEPPTTGSSTSSTSTSTSTSSTSTSTSTPGTSTETTVSSSSPTTATPPPNGPNCPSNGSQIIENPEDCTTYYVCIEGDFALIDCPPGYGFDKEEKNCAPAEEVGCNSDVTTTPSPNGPTCPSTGIATFPNPADCGSFFICIEGTSQLITCPIGYEFSVETERCELPEVAQCSGSSGSTSSPSSEPTTGTPTTATPTSGTPTTVSPTTGNPNPTTGGPSADCQGKEDGITLPNPQDCTMFYQCSNGVAFANHCPPGLEFNASVGVCDRPETANCSIQS